MTAQCHWLGLAVLVLSANGCAPPSPTSEPTTSRGELPTVVVTTTPLGTRPLQRSVTAVGTLHGFDEVTLAPKVDGRVEKLWVDVGDPAIPGSVLLELDTTDYRLAVMESRRSLDAELARLGLDDLPYGPLDVEEVPAVRKAEVARANAQVRVDRVRDLYQRKAASKDEFDLIATELKLADATKQDVVTQSLATLASARLRKAMLDSALQRLEDCKLRVPVPEGWTAWAAVVGPGFSPLRYEVAQKLVAEGEMVRSMPVTNAFKLVIDHALKLHVSVPERQTANVKIGQKVEVRVDAYTGAVFLGRITRVNPTIDPMSRSFDVEVAVPNLDGRLKPGGFARASIQVRTDPAVKIVPPEAVLTFAGVSKLFVIENNKARAIPVTLGERDKTWVEVLGDVPADAQVVVSGLTQLVDGSPIQLRK